MAGISEDTFHKILQQIQTQAIASQRSLSVVNAQLASKSRERKILELTQQQLTALKGPSPGSAGSSDQDVPMYKGVGKAFIARSSSEISKEHNLLEKELGDDISNLTKKAKYLEKQVTDAQNQLKDIFHAQTRQEQ